MDNYSEGLATGMALSQGNNGSHGYCCSYPMYPAYGGYAGGGFGSGFGFGGGWEGIIGLIAVASIFGNGGWGFGGGNGGCRGNCATQADLAAGFNNSAVLGNLNDLTLAQAQGFAGVQQTLCQGFSGVNATVNTAANTINQGICNLGYEVQGAFNGVSRQIADCCCDLKTMNLENRYLNEKQTCDLIQAGQANTQRIIDYLNCKETQELRDKLQAANFQISQLNQNAFISANQEAQTAELIRRLGRDCPSPAFLVPNPNCCYNYGLSNTSGCGNNCCGF